MTNLTLFDLEVIRPMNRFHNTTGFKGAELKEHEFKAGKLNKRVLDFFKAHPCENYNPFEVWKALGVNSCIRSSVQRSISDLTEMGYLEKLDGKQGRPFVQRMGQYGISFCWRLK